MVSKDIDVSIVVASLCSIIEISIAFKETFTSSNKDEDGSAILGGLFKKSTVVVESRKRKEGEEQKVLVIHVFQVVFSGFSIFL